MQPATKTDNCPTCGRHFTNSGACDDRWHDQFIDRVSATETTKMTYSFDIELPAHIDPLRSVSGIAAALSVFPRVTNVRPSTQADGLRESLLNESVTVLRQILNDLPTRKDWLDPLLEARGLAVVEQIAALTATATYNCAWKPIDSAPKDGTRILLLHSSELALSLGSWCSGGGPHGGWWKAEIGGQIMPTRWCPIPPYEAGKW